MSELPEGWAETSLTNIVISSLGGDWGKDCADGLSGYEKVRVVRGTDFKDLKTRRGARAAERCIKQASLVSRRLAEGDIVVEVSGGGPTQPVGRTILIDKVTLDNSPLPLVCSNFFRQVRLHELIDSAYVNLFLSHAYYKGEFDEFQTQTTNLRNLNFTKFLEGVRIDLPPLSEQRRIVAKLEKLLSRVDAAQARLASVPRILKRFRQSVLAAACSGRLTADWRTQNKVTESTIELLRRIASTRIQSFEAECKEATQAGHRRPRRPSNLEPRARSNEDAQELPESWFWLSFEDAASSAAYSMSSGPFGSALGRKDYQNAGIPVVRGQNIQGGKFVLSNFVYISEKKAAELERSTAFPRDIIVVAVGSSGQSAMVPNELPIAVLSQNCNKIKLDESVVLPEYVNLSLQIENSLVQLQDKTTDTARPFLSLTNLKTLLLPIPPLAEQQEIVRRVEALFKTADALEARYRTAKAHVDKLTQSILARAFRGELVITEAELARQEGRDYEPASVLLERIRQERAQQAAPTKPKPKQRRAARKAASSTKLFI